MRGAVMRKGYIQARQMGARDDLLYYMATEASIRQW